MSKIRIKEHMTTPPDVFHVVYEDVDGVEWMFFRSRKPRYFIREDGLRLSHTKMSLHYEFKKEITNDEAHPSIANRNTHGRFRVVQMHQLSKNN